MQVIVKCPKCGRSWHVAENVIDRRITCHWCGRLFKVPRLEEIPKASKVIQESKSDVYVDEEGNIFG